MGEPIPKHYPKKRTKPTTKTANRERRMERIRERSERRSGLREELVDRCGGMCEWPSCELPMAHMAHIEGIGRGGDPMGVRDDLRNVAGLCVYHHDLLDGRERPNLKEIESLLKAYVGTLG